MQLNVRQAAELLSVSEKTVYRWIADGQLPTFRVSGQYRISRAELVEWVTTNKLNASPALFVDSAAEAAPLPELAEALQAGGIFYRIEGVDKAAALAKVVEMLRLPEEVDRTFLLQVLLARESLESTGIGDGVAVPHVRNPIVLHVSRPTVTLCFLERPVAFGALDGKPVHALFTLISPTVKAHLFLLSRLCFALRDPEFKELVRVPGSRERILECVWRLTSSLPPCAGPGGSASAEGARGRG
jgi:nitrogen PTS system EIIA component